MVEIVRNTNASRVRWYAAGENGRKKAFIALPPEMIDKKEEVDKAVNASWNRAVAFGAVAETAKALLDKGVELLELARVRVRGNDFVTDDGDIMTGNDLVVLRWEGDEAKKLMAEFSKKEKAASKATSQKPRG